MASDTLMDKLTASNHPILIGLGLATQDLNLALEYISEHLPGEYHFDGGIANDVGHCRAIYARDETAKSTLTSVVEALEAHFPTIKTKDSIKYQRPGMELYTIKGSEGLFIGVPRSEQ